MVSRAVRLAASTTRYHFRSPMHSARRDHAHDDDVWRRRYGPWAVITGASRGIGRAFAETAASRGLHIALVGRHGAVLRTVADELRVTHGVETRVVVADLAEPAGCNDVLEETRALDVGFAVLSAG